MMEHIKAVDDLEYYQKWTRQTWKKDDDDDTRLTHACLGLAGESGEVVDLFKKLIFTPSRLEGEDYRGEVVKELGDVLYYLCRIADECGIDMHEVIDTNISKLEKRYGTA